MLPNQDPPEGWPKPRRTLGRVLSVVLFGLLTLLSLALIGSAVSDTQITETVVFTCSALLFGHLVGLSASQFRQPAPSTREPSIGTTDQGEQGMAFLYSRWSYYWLSVVLGAVAVMAAGFAVAAARRGTAAGWAVAVVAVAATLFVVWFLVTILRLAPGRVVVTPTGIYHRSLAFEHFVPWEAVVDVTAIGGRIPRIIVKALPASGTRQRRYTGRLSPGIEGLPFLVVRTTWLGANALPAYRAIRQYFRNPETRSDLRHVDRPAGT